MSKARIFRGCLTVSTTGTCELPWAGRSGSWALGKSRNGDSSLNDNTHQVLNRPVLAGFGEFQPHALLVLGQPGLQLELEQLQLETGLQIAVDSRLGDRCFLAVSFLASVLVEWYLLKADSTTMILATRHGFAFGPCDFPKSLPVDRGSASI